MSRIVRFVVGSRSPLRRLVTAAAIVLVTPALLPAAAADATSAHQVAPKPHQHVWVKQTRKEWVPPERKVVHVGVDSKGNPIYETKSV